MIARFPTSTFIGHPEYLEEPFLRQVMRIWEKYPDCRDFTLTPRYEGPTLKCR